MIYPDCIIDEIDAAIAGVFPANSQVMGIAQLVTRPKDGKDTIWPARYKGNGDCDYAGVDDNYPAVTYHRSLNMALSRVGKSGYGDAAQDTRATHNMSLVVYANKDNLDCSGDQLAMRLQQAFPDTIKGKSGTGLKLVAININSIVLSDTQVFGEEYKNVPPFLGPEHILLKINYSIESTYDKRCFNTCQ